MAAISPTNGWGQRLVLTKRAEHPIYGTKASKWCVTALVAVAAFIDPVSYTILYPALPEIPVALRASQSVANLASSLSFIGPSLMPLYWGALAERQGRRSVYLVAMSLFLLFTALAGSAQSIEALIITRVLASFTSCAVSIAGGAVVADIWDVKERGFAMSIYYLGQYAGPAVGPVIGGFLVHAWGWRSAQWFLCIYSAGALTLVAFFLPETLPSISTSAIGNSENTPDNAETSQPLSQHGSLSVRERTVIKRAVSELTTPLEALRYLGFPAIALICYLAATNFAAIIATATSLQNAYSNAPYNFSLSIVGLLYLPMPIGIVPGGLIGGKWADHIMHRVAQKRAATETAAEADTVEKSVSEVQLTFLPEDRLCENAWFSVVLLPCALIFYGWTIQTSSFWFLPMIPWFLIGFATGLIFSLVTTMLTEMVPHRSATMVALNALARNLFAALAGSVTQPLVTVMGTGRLYVLFAVIGLGNLAVVASLQRWGARWRDAVDRYSGYDRGPPQGQSA